MSINIIGHPQDKGGGVALFLSQELFLGRFRSSRVVLACSSLLWVMAACSGCSSFYKRRLLIIFSLSNLLKMTRIWTRIFTRGGSCTVLQNRASVITKWENFFVLQSRVSGITKQVGFTKWDNFYYKKEKLLLQSGAGIAKWNICYKSGRSNNHSNYNNFEKVTYDFNVEPSWFTA